MRRLVAVLALASACVPTGGFDAGPAPIPDGGTSAADAGFDAGLPQSPWVLEDFAGTGTPGLVDGAAGQAQFNQPTALAIDALDQLYVADTGNRAIRKIDVTGAVSTVVATGLVDPQGVAVDSRGTIYVADTREQCVKQFGAGGLRDYVGTCTMGVMGFRRCYDSGAGTVGPGDIAGPMGLWADSDAGLLYIADAEHQLVRFAVMGRRELGTLAGREDSTAFVDGACGRSYCCGASFNLAGCRPAQGSIFRGPVAVALSPSGDLLVADRGNCAIRRISTPSAAACRVSTVFGSGCMPGAPSSLSLNSPLAVAGGADDTVFVSDTANQRVVRLDPSLPMANRLEELPGKGLLSNPWGLAVDSRGRVFVVDSGHHRIRVFVPR